MSFPDFDQLVEVFFAGVTEVIVPLCLEDCEYASITSFHLCAPFLLGFSPNTPFNPVLSLTAVVLRKNPPVFS